MDTHEFIDFCEAAEHGRERFVRHTGRHHNISSEGEMGKVIRCDGRRFEVETGSGRHTWAMEECEPVHG